jgi:CarD family transcriptional regulator
MFKPGDKVVYPHHGAAVVEKREKRKDPTGQTTEYLVLRMAHGDMTLAVPVANAEDVGMRWPISKEDVEDLFEVLQKRDIREPANWSRRFKNHQEKLKSGDVYQVAEVVRNLALRDQAKGLSAGEKMLYTKALDVLVSELAFALNTTEEKAMATVEDALS